MTVWNEAKPESGDPLSDLPSILTTNAIAFRQAVEKHSYWTDSSGLSAGITRLSDGSFGPGSARAYFAPFSSLSTAASTAKPLAGRLFLASDTKRLYGFTSTGTVLLGSAAAVVFLGPSLSTIPTNVRTLVQIGAVSQAPGAAKVTFPTAYTNAPSEVQLMAQSSSTTYFGMVSVNTAQLTASGFSSCLSMVYGTSSTMTILWRSTGTVAL